LVVAPCGGVWVGYPHHQLVRGSERSELPVGFGAVSLMNFTAFKVQL